MENVNKFTLTDFFQFKVLPRSSVENSGSGLIFRKKTSKKQPLFLPKTSEKREKVDFFMK